MCSVHTVAPTLLSFLIRSVILSGLLTRDRELKIVREKMRDKMKKKIEKKKNIPSLLDLHAYESYVDDYISSLYRNLQGNNIKVYINAIT